MSEPTKRESYAALAAVTWMGGQRGKKPKQIEESLIKLLDDMHAGGYEAGLAAAFSRAITRCEGVSEVHWGKWKHDADQLEQGKSIGADECEAAIREEMGR
jgi:hypothetical protein